MYYTARHQIHVALQLVSRQGAASFIDPRRNIIPIQEFAHVPKYLKCKVISGGRAAGFSTYGLDGDKLRRPARRTAPALRSGS